jgi:hypothetical protein
MHTDCDYKNKQPNKQQLFEATMANERVEVEKKKKKKKKRCFEIIMIIE